VNPRKLLQVNQVFKRLQSTVAVDDVDSSQIHEKTKTRPFSEIPSPPSWPLIGHLPLMMKGQNRMDKMFDEMRVDLGDIFKVYVPGQGDMVVIFRPEDVKMLYKNDGRIPVIPGFDMFEWMRKNTMKDRYTTTGLINNSEDWYDIRHKVQQDMMRPKSALYYISDLEDIAIEFTEMVKENKDENGMLEPCYLINAFALECVGSMFMGTRLGALKGTGDGKRLIDLAALTGEHLITFFFLPPKFLPYVPKYKSFIAGIEESFDICKKHIDNAIENVNDGDDTIIAKLVKKCGKDSPIPLIMGIDALQVGIDTTGTTGAFLLYHLASNPEKQEKLYKEICDIIGPHGEMTETALAKMKYMKACQTESQRIAPATFGSSRRTDKDMVLGGYEIPKGITVIRSGSSSSNDPRNFSEPEKFLPERWLRGCPERHTADSFANIPFGHGARACIGQRFARLELYMMMVKLVQKYRMEYSGPEVGTFIQFLSVPDKPINIKFIERGG